MFGNNHHLQPSWNVDTFPTVVESCACTIYFKKKQRREWCISSSRKWLAKNPACSNLSILGRICFSFWVCQPGNTTPWRRRCPKECPQEGPIDRCSMRPSDLGIAQHLRSTLTSWILAPSAPHTHIHNSIISIHAYMSSYEMMDTWWHLVSACSLQNCQVAHGLIAQIEKEETHASGKIEKQKQPISLDSCHQMSRVCPVGMANRGYSDLFASICTMKHCNTGGVTFFGKHMLKQKDMKSESTWK